MSRVQKNEKENDQAGELRSRIERHKAKSSLPKRSKVHQNKKKKSKVKKFPMIQLLALFFILLPIGFYTLYTYLQDRPVPVVKSDQVVFSEEANESIPTTATADDLKEKESAKAEAEKEKEEAAAKAKAQQEAKKKAKAQQEAEEKAKAQREAEEKAKAQREAEEKAKAQQEADEKAKKAESEKKKAAENVQAAKPDKEGYKVVLHTVQGEETLFRISMNYYKSQEGITLIREWNGLNGNEISKGQVLKIPIKK
ncbi:LysM peptidoglycan-binding domain-containing protein [Peribacillus simplex]|uniref:Elastin-binding protein EbpS n=1 Tax=Peribacillus simplex TaxID=1478 RepID=A0A9W4KUZ8_9BACI|nr:LysM peptidoglycan-binding domain-containing protein [Peribacillus simplex]MDR4925743.1 LysM peptidoglycan-binding domain-containing protein [Peribacillus simplex]WHX89617.1 LysM peptidoglycan-binding domain-containing protein [Peribacillus simplex]CAH0228790.1 Elastin-binding protein EbpS [Peribacillus simplex]